MAKEIDLTKKVSDEAPETDVKESKSKEEKKASKDKDAKPKKAAAKKPKKGIVKFFKDAKSEFKKVVWPTPKQTTNNTIVVIVVCVLAAAFMFGVDTLFGLLNRLMLGQG